MFQFVTKKEYWDVVDSGILNEIKTETKFFRCLKSVVKAIREKNNLTWHLKSIQDAIAYKYLYKYSNASIAEIGGGNSRLLPILARKNRCFNIDEFKGVGQGPTKEVSVKGITNILTFIGNSSDFISNEQFDVIFSVSVVEHVPDEQLSIFFEDCNRILRPSGIMIHLIDAYLEDTELANRSISQRILTYRSFLDDNLFIPLEPPIVKKELDVKFSTSFATNPDNMMEQWNKSVPQLKTMRENAQSVTLIMAGTKPGMGTITDS